MDRRSFLACTLASALVPATTSSAFCFARENKAKASVYVYDMYGKNPLELNNETDSTGFFREYVKHGLDYLNATDYEYNDDYFRMHAVKNMHKFIQDEIDSGKDRVFIYEAITLADDRNNSPYVMSLNNKRVDTIFQLRTPQSIIIEFECGDNT